MPTRIVLAALLTCSFLLLGTSGPALAQFEPPDDTDEGGPGPIPGVPVWYSLEAFDANSDGQPDIALKSIVEVYDGYDTLLDRHEVNSIRPRSTALNGRVVVSSSCNDGAPISGTSCRRVTCQFFVYNSEGDFIGADSVYFIECDTDGDPATEPVPVGSINDIDGLTPQEFYSQCFNSALSHFRINAATTIAASKPDMNRIFLRDIVGGTAGAASIWNVSFGGGLTRVRATQEPSNPRLFEIIPAVGGAFALYNSLTNSDLTPFYDRIFGTACTFLAEEQECRDLTREEYANDPLLGTVDYVSNLQINRLINDSDINAGFARGRCR